MISASVFAVLLEHPSSPVRSALPNALLRRTIMGLAMGTTAIALIYSPWGKRSGAHFNPAVTLTFFRLGKVAPRDLLGYVCAQFVGGALGMAGAAAAMRPWLAHPAVRYVVTQPGVAGVAGAFAAEFAMTFLLMIIVLAFSNTPRLAGCTGLAAGGCVALFIAFEAPLSGMSLNPARTLASAIASRDTTALWVYFTAPPLGMLAAAAAYRARRGASPVKCAKLQHPGGVRCIFCEYALGKLIPEAPRP
ncbi:MAG TPA: aquaporin [Opitutaceae bacterium]|nr:aquaporin [Opitutaceae bacterium]